LLVAHDAPPSRHDLISLLAAGILLYYTLGGSASKPDQARIRELTMRLARSHPLWFTDGFIRRLSASETQSLIQSIAAGEWDSQSSATTPMVALTAADLAATTAEMQARA
jgi:hypothetical protein